MRDPIGMHVKVLGQGLFYLHGNQRHFRLKRRGVVAAESSRHARSCSRPYWPPSGTKSTYADVKFTRATSIAERELIKSDLEQPLSDDTLALQDEGGQEGSSGTALQNFQSRRLQF